jgi:uncharacterized membrane protein YkgB
VRLSLFSEFRKGQSLIEGCVRQPGVDVRGFLPITGRIVFAMQLTKRETRDDLDYHFMRASMVIIYAFFGYQKWFNYEAQALIPYITHGPLIFWMYPVFGIRGATRFLGVAEWTFGLLLLLGFWNKQLGILGAIGSCFSFIATFTILPFFPNGWEPSAGGFPAMTEHVAFLMKDLVLLAASFYLLKQDVLRAASARMSGNIEASLGSPELPARRKSE